MNPIRDTAILHSVGRKAVQWEPFICQYTERISACSYLDESMLTLKAGVTYSHMPGCSAEARDLASRKLVGLFYGDIREAAYKLQEALYSRDAKALQQQIDFLMEYTK